MMQDELLLSFGVGDARQADSTLFAQIKPDFDQDDLFKRVNNLGWRQTFQPRHVVFVSDRPISNNLRKAIKEHGLSTRRWIRC